MTESIEERLPSLCGSAKGESGMPWDVYRRLQFFARLFRGAPVEGSSEVLLLWLGGSGDVMWRAVVGADLAVGREVSCDVVFPGRRVSRRHCLVRRIVSEDGTLEVEDLGSINGTWVNGVRLPERGKRILQDGDVIEIGGAGLAVAIPAGQH